jgi:hypothetical protein
MHISLLEIPSLLTCHLMLYPVSPHDRPRSSATPSPQTTHWLLHLSRPAILESKGRIYHNPASSQNTPGGNSWPWLLLSRRLLHGSSHVDRRLELGTDIHAEYIPEQEQDTSSQMDDSHKAHEADGWRECMDLPSQLRKRRWCPPAGSDVSCIWPVAVPSTRRSEATSTTQLMDGRYFDCGEKGASTSPYHTVFSRYLRQR